MNNINIKSMKQLLEPSNVIKLHPMDVKLSEFIRKSRREISDIINKKSNKKLLIIGPCSIHDIKEAYDYAKMLRRIMDRVKDKIFIVMRVYFEKPRTTTGWKGLINDPDLDNSFQVNKGLVLARKLLCEINKLGVPCGYEILDTITPQYIADLISWGSIGARTVESQVHRQLASGMSMPIGFKNGSSGDIKLAVNGMISSGNEHCFMGINGNGVPSICITKGNKNTHIILRGGTSGPNYNICYVDRTKKLLKENGLPEAILIDCSHGNSLKDHTRQQIVFEYICKFINETSIIGMMLESNIKEGRTDIDNLQYGKSITDSCIDIEKTEQLVQYMYGISSKL